MHYQLQLNDPWMAPLPEYQFINYLPIENYDTGIIKHKLNIYKWTHDKHKNKRQGSRVCNNIKVNNTINCVQYVVSVLVNQTSTPHHLQYLLHITSL